MSHFQEVCEYGRVHNQCRCIGPKEERPVVCDRPESHAPTAPLGRHHRPDET